ncbi:nonribosomal peptide synthetase DhbF [Entomortierella parvispora]|uniref:Nonribosomal peptide synthetase DhbF n=1 Tax=Entomortierella parvispora TaxID=205924 RepID=A0A9P3H9A5_9FUNG|nr:nonribosomal peptide synthetase DhbF [Entomortierella parvispora]
MNSYYAKPMSRQTSNTSSVSTIQASGSDDGVITIKDASEDFKVQSTLQQKSMNDVLRVLDLPTDRRRPVQHSFAGAECRFDLEMPLKQLLTVLGHDNTTDLAVVLLVAWSIVLYRLSGEDTFIIGMGYVDENGLSTQPVPVQFDVSAEPSTLLLINSVKLALEVADPQLFVEDDYATIRKPEKTLASFQVAFYSHNGGLAQPPLDYVSIQGDLELHLLQGKEDSAFSIHYATDLYDKDTVERYAGYLRVVLLNMVAYSTHPVSSFNIISSTEKRLLLEKWNETTVEYPEDRCIQHLYEDQVDKSPNAIAVIEGEKTFTFLELNAIADRFACQLVDAGVKHGDFIAMLLERSIELIAAQIAALKVGAAYVPMDSKAPVERQAFIIKDSSATLVVTDTKTEVPFKLQCPLLRFDLAALTSMGANHIHGNMERSTLDTAYVMYTSGSTGLPKGVMVSHRGIARLTNNNGWFDVGPGDRVAFASNTAFDLSTLDVWTPLLNGGCVVIIDQDTLLNAHQLAAAMERHQINALQLPTAVFHQYAFVIGSALSRLKYLLFAGEQGLIEACTEVLRHGGPVRLINAYGPTETVYCTSYSVTDALSQSDLLPIGRPINNTRLYVLDKYRNPVPVGVIGELYVAGPGVANGYLNRPDLTAERFLPDPFSNKPHTLMYKTGDLVRYLPDGNLVYMGRTDFQVKIRGFRIEIGEIEARLAEHPQVREVVVLAVGESGDKRLVAYVVATPIDDFASTLRNYLMASLPEYMVPSAFVCMDVMPLTNNGKVDRRALPEPDSTSFVSEDYVAPQGSTEVALAAIWCELLKIGRVGRHDNFFMLGGHSLLAVRMMNRVSALGVQLPLSTLFSAPTLSAFADVINTNISKDDLSHLNISPISRDGPLELSFAQQRLWFLAQLEGVSVTYHIPMAFSLHGTLNIPALEKAFDSLFARHESLRSIFVALDGQPKVQLLGADKGLPLSFRDIQGEKNKGDLVKQIAALEATTQFDLEKGPLIRVQLLQLAKDEYLILLTKHHIITDGWSNGVLFRDLTELYAAYCSGQPNPLPPLSIQYPDYAAWHRQWLSGDRHKEQVAYWRETLADAPVSIELPTDRPRPHQQSFSGASVPIRLDAKLSSALNSLSQRHGVTMYMTVLAAWSAVLSRLSGQDDLVIGTASANRNHPQVEQLIGFFVNTLALRIDLSGEPTVQQLLGRVQGTTIAAQSYQDLPFEQVVGIVQPPRRADQTPIFQVFFAWENNDNGVPNFQDVDIILEETEYNTAKFDLELNVGEENGEVVGCLGYSTALFDHHTMERHVGYLEAMLRWMTVNTEQAIVEAPILGSTELELLTQIWNMTDRPYPENTCIHHLFEGQVKLSPEAIAIMHGDWTLTYHELNSRANRVAHEIVAAGVKPGDSVAILLPRSFELIIAQLAILKVGAAYVPIDPKAPVDRQVYITSDSNSKLLITDESTKVPEEIPAPLFRLKADHENTEEMHVLLDVSVPTMTSSRNTAYIMYTSGTTGRPKGVMVSHRGVARLAINNGFADVGPGDRVSFAINPTFDPSTYEIWSTLLTGASIVIIDHETYVDAHLLEAAMNHYQLTSLVLPMALFHQYAFIIGHALSKLKFIMCGGEQGMIEAFSEVLSHNGSVRLINAYGPTETTVVATAYEVTSAIRQLDRLPIGRPMANTQVYVLDKYRNPVPIGAVGELYIGGPGVAIGYLNRPDLTVERFLPDPFSNAPDARMYRSGDLVRYLPDGNIIFMGRSDDQVKIRGFRIELKEIEAQLAEHPQVREVVVLVIGEKSSDKRLVAYVVSAPDENLVHKLREHLGAILPEYMVPSAFVRLDAFPLTNNGKVDRRALPEPDSASFFTQGYVAPQGETEVALAELWSDLLKIERVGRHDNFFTLGGHSLLSVQMIARLHALGYSLSVRVLFDNPVLRVLAATLSKHRKAPQAPSNLIEADMTSITPEMLPLISLSQDDIDHIIDQVPGGVANIQDIYELSPLQDGILFHHMMATKGDPYLLLQCTAFDSRDLLDRYLTAFQKVVDRHDILRTAIMWKNLTSPAQVVLRQTNMPVKELSLDSANGPIIEQLSKLYNSRQCRIELSQAPLLRNSIVQDVDGRWILAHQLHHIIGDHSTLEVMEEEIRAFMEGRGESLETPQPYRNLIVQARLGISDEEHEHFFRNMLESIDTPSLPYGLSDIHNDTSSVTESHRMLPQELNSKLRDHAKRLGVSLAGLCHLAWAQVIAATSGQTQVVFGTVLLGRMQAGSGSDRTMGLFINTLPLRVHVGGAGVLEAVRRVQADLASLLEHEHASLALAQRCSSVPSGTPLFSAILNYRHNSTAFQQTNISPGMEVILGDERTNYPFMLSVEDCGSSLGLTAQAVHPYDPLSLCEYMQQALQSMAEALEHAPETPMQSLPILPAEEYNLVIRSWNDTNASYPSERCIHQLFEDQVQKTPEAIAVVHDDNSMTYRTLNSRAVHLSHKLVDMGVKSGDRVAILLPRSFELIIVQLAILKVGAAYVPIDAKAPMDRQTYMVADSGAKLLVINEETLVPNQAEVAVLLLGTNLADPLQDATVAHVPATIDTESAVHHIMGTDVAEDMQDRFDSHCVLKSSLDTAYVMYTSGSTGLPKGVMVSHRGIARLTNNNGWFDVGPGDRVAFASNTAFDLSTLDVWTPLLNGGCVVIIDQDTLLNAHQLAAAMERHQINALQLPTAVFHQYAFVIGSALSRLKYLLFAGEQGLIEACTEVLRHGGPVRLINAYGPTETVYCTSYSVTDALSQSDLLPIGRPINNTRLYVLDKYRNPVPVGVIGELYVAGPGVANGYLNRPDLTAERFLPDPFSNKPHTLMYKTGDLVRYLPDGNLVYMGRTDFQVKIRGFRIEIGEIEARLAEHPQVREVVVLAVGESGDKRLVAYVVATPIDDFASTLRNYLMASLPEYMVPSAFVCMDVMPLTNNGKVDRRALPEPDSTSFVSEDYVAPQGSTEVALAAIWCELLKIGRVGRHDNFFMLGGHSLLAVRMMNRVSALGVQLPLSTLFSAPTLSAFADVITTNISNDDLSHLNISPISRDGPLELSFAQQRLWFLAQLEGVSVTYHIPMAFSLHGTLNIPALEKAFDSLFARHESLRSIFVALDGQPKVQLLGADKGLPLSFRDIQGEKNKGDLVKQIAALEATTQFDLEKGPLIRVQLLQLAKDEYLILLTKHHIITDGWSNGVLFRDLTELYAAYCSGQPNPLPPLSIQYPDYAAWHRQWLSGDRHKKQVAYWRETLADAPVSIELPTDRPRPHQQSFSGASVPIRLDAKLSSALNSLSQRHGVTMYMTVLAAWSAVLSRLSGQDDLVIGTASANRNHPQVEQLIGFFVNTLALRIDLSGEPTVQQLLGRVQGTTIAAQSYQDLPFEQVVGIVQPPRRADQTPIFQVFFAWENNDNGVPNFQDVDIILEEIEYNIAKFDLELSIGEENGEVVGCLGYSTALFDHHTMERHVGYLEAMLRWMTVNTEQAIVEAPILGSTELELLTQIWNMTDRPYPENTCIHHLFEGQVKLSPEAIAIMHGDWTLTYHELNSRANRVAHEIVAAGVKPGDSVAILLPRSFELIIAQLAILKVGAAYVPIDPKAPVDRQVYITSDSNSKLLITDESTKVPEEIPAPLFRLKADHENTEEMHDVSVPTMTSSRNAAYIMYTSGTTGRPKGVMVSHRGIARLAINNGFADVGPGDRVSFAINPTFDPSTYEIWSTLLTGASIVIIDHETYVDAHLLEAAMNRYQLTSLVLPTALFHQYAFIIGHALSKLKFIMCGGEQGMIEAFSEVLSHNGSVRLINAYGPTETTVVATAYEVTSAIRQLDRLPIGRPMANTQVYVLDKYRNPVPIGAVGELYIGGPGVAIGYLNRPDLTVERFLPDPFSNAPDARMYRSGDLVRYLPDGNIIFMGRSDDQVKIRGFRIELKEIEAQLAEHPQVREVIVLMIGEKSSDKRLVAYVVSAPDEHLVHKLREHLGAILPEYMVPSAFVRLDSFPLTNNGKVDRRALPEPDSASFFTQGYVAPQGETEVALAELWSDLLKIERVGRHDNFFTLGGHSLLAVRMIHTIRSRLGFEFKLQTLFTSPTVAELTLKLLSGASSQDDEYGVLLPLKTQGCRPPLFCIHPGLGLSWQYMSFAKHLHPEQPLYGLQSRGLDGKAPVAASMEELTLDYIDHIRKIQPHGPYHLLGWSFGGTAAHNIAVELEKQSERVPLLVIMDSTVDVSLMDNDELNEEDGAKLLFSRLGDKHSTSDGRALWKRMSPIAFNNSTLAKRFTPSVYSDDILFFRATVPQNESAPLVDPATWTPHTSGKLHVHDVDCNHTEMGNPENIALIGGIVAGRLEELQR